MEDDITLAHISSRDDQATTSPSKEKDVSLSDSKETDVEAQTPPILLTSVDQSPARSEWQALKQTLKTHHVAVLWSLAISASIVMEAYDASLISGFFALPAFAKRFGTPLGDGRWNVE